MEVIAINPKHQKLVNKFLKANAKYDELVNAGTEESRKGDNAYNKAQELYLELPKREQANLKIEGYRS
jgi:hypothetical protein